MLRSVQTKGLGARYLAAVLVATGCVEETYCDHALYCDDSGASTRGSDAATTRGVEGDSSLDSADSSSTDDTVNGQRDAATATPTELQILDSGSPHAQSPDSGSSVDAAPSQSGAPNNTPPAEAGLETRGDAAHTETATTTSDSAFDSGATEEDREDASSAACGDGFVQSGETCDHGGQISTDLGDCNANCSGFYEKKYIRATEATFDGDLGGPEGAAEACVAEFGDGWRALLTGGSRRATLTPNVGDEQVDWVLSPYTHYYNWQDELIWRTDTVALLGSRDGERLNLWLFRRICEREKAFLAAFG